jgi:chorismate mutase
VVTERFCAVFPISGTVVFPALNEGVFCYLQLPIVKIPGLQDLQRIYFCFGEPIRTSQYNGNWENVKFCEEVRDKTKASVEQGIRFLQHVQEADPQRLTINRSVWLRRVAGLFQDMSKTNVNADDAEDSTSSSSRKV